MFMIIKQKQVAKPEVEVKKEDTGRQNIRKVLIVRDLRGFHSVNIVNMAENALNVVNYKRSDVAINK